MKKWFFYLDGHGSIQIKYLSLFFSNLDDYGEGYKSKREALEGLAKRLNELLKEGSDD